MRIFLQLANLSILIVYIVIFTEVIAYVLRQEQFLFESRLIYSNQIQHL